jgi:serine/threonine protein kinase
MRTRAMWRGTATRTAFERVSSARACRLLLLALSDAPEFLQWLSLLPSLQESEGAAITIIREAMLLQLPTSHVCLQESEGVPITTIREAMLLRELHHPNLLKLHSVYVNNSGGDVAISLIFEFVEHDLHEMMQCQKGYTSGGQLRLPQQHLPAAMVRSLAWQLLRGLDHLHRSWVIHRDLKPSNLLVTGIDSDVPGVRAAWCCGIEARCPAAQACNVSRRQVPFVRIHKIRQCPVGAPCHSCH